MSIPTTVGTMTANDRSWKERVESGLTILVFFVIPTALIAYDARYHEFWRDEAHAYLTAAHAPIPEFFSVMRIEGIPFLFHLLLKFFATFLPPVPTLLVVGWISFVTFLFGTYRLILAICGDRLRSLVATLLLSATYNYAYELGAIIRQYGISLGLALLTMALLRDALRSREMAFVYQAAVVCACGVSTSAHAASICGGTLVAYGIIAIARRELRLRSVLALVGTLPFFALTLYLATPTPGRSPLGNGNNHVPLDQFFVYAQQAIAGSFTPQDWWVAPSFGDVDTQNHLARLRGWSIPALAYGALLALVSRIPRILDLRALEWFDLLSVLVAWVPLAEIVVNHYWGSPRHHLFFSVPAVVVTFGWILNSPWRSWLFLFTAPYLLFELAVAAMVLRLDADLPFSDAKRASTYLPQNAHLVVESFVFQEAYLLWRPDIVARGTDQMGRRALFVVPTPDEYSRVPAGPLIDQECAEAPDRVYYSGNAFGGACMERVMEQTPHTEQFRAEERFDLWRVDCDCLKQARH